MSIVHSEISLMLWWTPFCLYPRCFSRFVGRIGGWVDFTSNMTRCRIWKQAWVYEHSPAFMWRAYTSWLERICRSPQRLSDFPDRHERMVLTWSRAFVWHPICEGKLSISTSLPHSAHWGDLFKCLLSLLSSVSITGLLGACSSSLML